MCPRRLQKYLVLVCILCGLVFLTKFDLSLNAHSSVHYSQIDGSRIIPNTRGNITVISNNTAKYQDAHVLWSKEEETITDCVTDIVIGNKRKNIKTLESFSDVSFRPTATEFPEMRKKSFKDIFDTRDWGTSRNENESVSGISSSGPGSLLNSTREIVAILENLINKLKIQTGKSKIKLLDLPCGDFQWMGLFLSKRNDVEYTGIDIVPDLIQNHRNKFASRSDWKFVHTDIIEHPLNESYDFILCRMLVQHLVTVDAITVLKRFSQSGSGYLLSSTFSAINYNQELLLRSRYRYRLINLEIPPFSLTRPICLGRDGGDHYMGLWKLPLTRMVDCKTPHGDTMKFKSFSKYVYFCQ